MKRFFDPSNSWRQRLCSHISGENAPTSLWLIWYLVREWVGCCSSSSCLLWKTALNQSVTWVSSFLLIWKRSKKESQVHSYILEKSSKTFITGWQISTAVTEHWNDDLGIMLHGQIWIKIWKNFKSFSRKILFCRLLTTKFQIFLAWKWVVVLHTLPKAGGKQLVFACTVKTSRKTRLLNELVLETQQQTFWWSILGTKTP